MASSPDLENFGANEDIVMANTETYNELESGLGSTHKSRMWTCILLSIAFLAVAIITLVLCLGFKADFDKHMAKHNGYMELINYASDHAICNLSGVVTGVDIDEETGRYAFGYRVDVSGSSLAGGRLDAFSPYVYTAEEIEQNYSTGTAVQIAVKDGRLDQNTPSVNMSYADYNLDNYPPFKKAKTGYIILLVAMGVSFAITFSFFGFAMQSLYFMRKENAKTDDEDIEIVKQNGKRVTNKEAK